MPDRDDDVLLTANQVCERYQISRTCLYYWRKGVVDCDFPTPLIVSGKPMWRRSDLVSWEENHRERRPAA